jgi:SPP1 family predicted phage head-tail adaptor
MSCKPKNPNALTPQKMNRKITLQTFTSTVDDEGIATEDWVNGLVLYAFRKPLSGRWREFFQSAGENAEKIFQYTIRYREGVADESMRIISGKKTVNDVLVDRVYEIKAVLDDALGDRTETWIMAQELTDG